MENLRDHVCACHGKKNPISGVDTRSLSGAIEDLASTAAVKASDQEAEWEEFYDEGRSRNYYLHIPSGRVQWQMPSEFHQSALKANDNNSRTLQRTLQAQTQELDGAD